MTSRQPEQPQKKRTSAGRGIRLFIVILLLIPFFMWGCWLVKSRKPMNLFILDKSSLIPEGKERYALFWVLNYNKYVQPDGSLYDVTRDYFGFFPQEQHRYHTVDLSTSRPDQLDSLARVYDMAYIADTYGVYQRDWFQESRDSSPDQPNDLLYGGLDSTELVFLKHLHQRQKPIVMEFASLIPPTSSKIRRELEALLHLRWSGWTGRYFISLDTLRNPEVPLWAIRMYEDQYDRCWDFKTSGIVLVNSRQGIVVLENERDLIREVPYLQATKTGQADYGLPREIPYAFWFNIVYADKNHHRKLAYFVLNPTVLGAQLLNKYNIPRSFPAVLVSREDTPVYYFAGDFADNPIQDIAMSYFRGITVFRGAFYNKHKIEDRRQFFWRFYLPLVSRILATEY